MDGFAIHMLCKPTECAALEDVCISILLSYRGNNFSNKRANNSYYYF